MYSLEVVVPGHQRVLEVVVPGHQRVLTRGTASLRRIPVSANRSSEFGILFLKRQKSINRYNE